MLTNAHITSWKARSGSDAEGRPTYGAELLSAPVRCAATAPNWRQSQTAEREDFAVDIMLTVNMASPPAVGDLVQCDHPDVAGRDLEVRKRADVSKPGLRGVMLYCGEVR